MALATSKPVYRIPRPLRLVREMVGTRCHQDTGRSSLGYQRCAALRLLDLYQLIVMSPQSRPSNRRLAGPTTPLAGAAVGSLLRCLEGGPDILEAPTAGSFPGCRSCRICIVLVVHLFWYCLQDA